MDKILIRHQQENHKQYRCRNITRFLLIFQTKPMKEEEKNSTNML